MAKSIPTFEGVFDGFKSPDSFFSDQVKTISFTITSGGTPDPITGTTLGGTATVYTADGFTRDVKDREFREVEVGDLVFACKQSDLGYSPAVNDKATINSTEYTVVEVSDRGSVVYAMQLRA